MAAVSVVSLPRGASVAISCASKLLSKAFTGISNSNSISTGMQGVLVVYTRLLLLAFLILVSFFPRASERRVLPIVGVCKTSSHLHIFSSSHLLIFTSSHLHIFSSSHLLIFTSSHLHIFSSSHLLIFTSHLHIFSSSHLLIFTSAHLHICSSSHLLIFTSAHLHIFSSSTSSLALLPSCPLALLPSCPLALLPSCPLALSFFSISLLKAGAGAVPTRRHETQPFHTK